MIAYIRSLLKLLNLGRSSVQKPTKRRLSKEELSRSRSESAKNGLKEEVKIATLLNESPRLRKEVFAFAGKNDTNKPFTTDVKKGKSDYGSGLGPESTKETRLGLQNKKQGKKSFGQVHRQSVDRFVEQAGLDDAIKEGLTHLCKQKSLKNRKLGNYKKLDEFLTSLEAHKEKILRAIFLGLNNDYEPDLICWSMPMPCGKKRLSFFRMDHIIAHCMKQEFKVRKSQTVIELGPALTLQKKGGDRGKSSANDVQFKIALSKLQVESYIYDSCEK